MAFALLSIPKRIYKTLANLRTGVVLLILVVIASAMGTFVLQRPVTEPDKLQAAYSPQMLRLLDRLTLTDIFHSWWFLTLLGLVSLSIIFVSVSAFPTHGGSTLVPTAKRIRTFAPPIPTELKSLFVTRTKV